MKYKFYILTTLILSISFLSFGQSEENLDTYGQSFDAAEINDYKNEKESLLSNSKDKIKIEGEILSSYLKSPLSYNIAMIIASILFPELKIICWRSLL